MIEFCIVPSRNHNIPKGSKHAAPRYHIYFPIPECTDSTDKYRSVVWQCNNKFKADEKCSTPHIREGVIKGVFIKALNSIVTDKGPSLDMTT